MKNVLENFFTEPRTPKLHDWDLGVIVGNVKAF